MLQRASLTKPGKRTDLTYTKEAKLKDTIHINEEETGDAKKKKRCCRQQFTKHGCNNSFYYHDRIPLCRDLSGNKMA